ncbi:hypothetical protein Slin15195_G115020 [Septoria linicola]|uniref:Secreted protein n=1 Tax=Septoria linicola TaxID=215465 RepID=A0A9Q9B659_9PEZI|nr:hypothetical protein Slin14017_G122990 [Septoria linicola]USW58183.1 hypothetical protein Slin15195_G115020 [Septoria linicola]
MRFFLAFLALIGFAVAIEGPRSVACGRKNKYVVQAVNDFCKKKNIVVPSDYAGSGSRVNYFALPFISGTCNPPQWVPSHICKAQFFQMCINGDAIGQRLAKFGRNKCQTWEIFSTKSQHRNAPDNPFKGKKKSKATWKGLFKTLGWGNKKRDVDDELENVEEGSFGEELDAGDSE